MRWASALLVASFALRLAWLFRYRVNTDEPQHLHVAWGWTQGLVQYRDVFDNHAPLFHLLAAPLIGLCGETPRIIFAGRLVILVISLLALVAGYRVGRVLFGERIALWGTVLVAFFPDFAGTAMEVRPDLLAAAFALGALTLVLEGRRDARSMLIAGLIAGAALATSLKMGIFFVATGLAAALVLPREAWRLRELALPMTCLTLGSAVLPGVIALSFASLGAESALVHGVFGHNALPELSLWRRQPMILVLYAVLLPTGAWLVRRHVARGAGDPRVLLRGIVLVGVAFYPALLALYGPLNTSQSLLPVYLLLGPFLAWGLERVIARCGGVPGHLPVAGAAWALLGTILLLVERPIWRDRADPQTQFIAEVLRLSAPGDFVLDLKGQAVFRARPAFAAYEKITRERIRLGLLPDEAPERLVATRTFLAAPDGPEFPDRTRRFLAEHYVSTGRLRVLGRLLATEASRAPRSAAFEIAIPGTYAVVSDGPGAEVTIDGSRVRGPIELAPGPHRFEASPGGRLALLWAAAAGRGATPF